MVVKKTWKEFVAEFKNYPELHEALANARRKPDTTGLAGLVNHVMDSSRFGHKTAMRYGPGCTFKDLQMIEDQTGGVYTDGNPSSASFAEFYTEDQP